MSNGFGNIFRLTSFGESHGVAVGGIVEGCPAGVRLSVEEIQHELDRRRPGSSAVTTARNEEDKVEILSGLFEGRTTGMPIGFIVRNRDARSEDYESLRDLYRPSHADYTWERKYGIRDYRGGGRSSAREHIARVVAGAIAKQVLATRGIAILGYTSRIGSLALELPYHSLPLHEAETNPVRCPDRELAERMENLIGEIQAAGDSVGGTVTCVITGLPAGLGEPVFDRFQARLAYAMMGINAAKGFEYGSGFSVAAMRGSAHNDPFILRDGQVRTETNRSGGIQGGVTNGEDVYFNVAFKPTSSISLPQKTLTRSGEETTLALQGRHDPCVVPRAVPVVEAMAAIVTLDFLLATGTSVG